MFIMFPWGSKIWSLSNDNCDVEDKACKNMDLYLAFECRNFVGLFSTFVVYRSKKMFMQT